MTPRSPASKPTASLLKQCSVEFGCQYLSVVQRNQINVFTEPAVHEMCTSKSSSADEIQSVAELAADCRQQMGDQMVPLDLLWGHAELNCDTVMFIDAHVPPNFPHAEGPHPVAGLLRAVQVSPNRYDGRASRLPDGPPSRHCPVPDAGQDRARSAPAS